MFHFEHYTWCALRIAYCMKFYNLTGFRYFNIFLLKTLLRLLRILKVLRVSHVYISLWLYTYSIIIIYTLPVEL